MATGDYSTLVGYEIEKNDVILRFGTGAGDEDYSEVVVLNGKWDQISKESKNWIKVVDSKGASITASDSPLRDPAEVVVDTTQWKGANKAVVTQAKAGLELDTLTTLVGATAAFGTANTSVHTLTFSGKNAVKTTADNSALTMSRINGANGKDTLYGSALSQISIVDNSNAPEVVSTSEAISEGGGSVNITNGGVKNGYQTIDVNITKTDYPQAQFTCYIQGGKIVYVEGDSNTTVSLTSVNVVATNNSKTTTYTLKAALGTLTGVNSYSDLGSKIADSNRVGYTNITTTETKLTLDGGSGNDYLYGYNSGGVLNGGVGNDTLRSGSGQVSMIGGAGNDTFLLTAKLSTAENLTEIHDYYSGSAGLQETKADATANKKEKGSDKLVVGYDTNYKKMDDLSTQSYIMSSSGYNHNTNTLVINVGGDGWTQNLLNTDHSYDQGLGTDATITGEFKTALNSNTFNVALEEGQYITLVEKGITYKQNVGAFGTSENAVQQTVDANYMGLVADSRITTLNGADSKKAMRLVAGNSIAQVTSAAGLQQITSAPPARISEQVA